MVTYRLAREEDYFNINEFFNRVHGAKRSLESFYWEFHNCPFGKSIYVIAEDGNKIVGSNCVIPIELVCSDKSIIKSGKSEDTLVDPEYRGQNIFNNIYDFLLNKCTENGIQVIWGYTPARKPFNKIGFSLPYRHSQSLSVNKIVASYRYLKSLNNANSNFDKFKIFGLCVFSKCKSFKLIDRTNLRAFIIKRDKVTEPVARLISSSFQNESDFCINQSALFQDWRIYNNPNFSEVQTFSFHSSSDELKALVVVNCRKDKVAYFCQTTFHLDLTNKEIVEILSYVKAQMFKTGVVLLRNWHFCHTNYNLKELQNFKKANFIHLNKGITFVWKNLGENNFNPENFVLSRISTQGVN